MKTVFILSICDEWHTRSTYETIGVFTSKKIAIDSLKACLLSNGDIDTLTITDLGNLERIGQTQGREDNFNIEEVTLNEIDL